MNFSILNELYYENCFLLYAKNKGADQLHINRTADQHLFYYLDSAIPLLPNFKPLAIFTVAVQPGLCRTWSEKP